MFSNLLLLLDLKLAVLVYTVLNGLSPQYLAGGYLRPPTNSIVQRQCEVQRALTSQA